MQQIHQEEQKEKIEYIEENDDSIKFQKFIYELFEKNGVLNDLRAHLRGHIIAVLKATGGNYGCITKYLPTYWFS